LKPNFVGIAGGVLAFISLLPFLPWWTMTLSAAGSSIDLSLYLYRATAMGITVPGLVSWYCWVALALVVVGGILGIVGSVTKYGKKLISGGASLALLSIIIFAVGLLLELSQLATTPILGTTIKGVSLFSSGSITVGEVTLNFTTYLSYGFWLALVSAIVMFAALKTHPKEEIVAPPPIAQPQPIPQPPP